MHGGRFAGFADAGSLGLITARAMTCLYSRDDAGRFTYSADEPRACRLRPIRMMTSLCCASPRRHAYSISMLMLRLHFAHAPRRSTALPRHYFIYLRRLYLLLALPKRPLDR